MFTQRSDEEEEQARPKREDAAMTYLREAFAELWRQDGLVVMARGLGVRRLLAKFLLLHCMHGDAPPPSPDPEEVEGKQTRGKRRRKSMDAWDVSEEGGGSGRRSREGIDAEEDQGVGHADILPGDRRTTYSGDGPGPPPSRDRSEDYFEDRSERALTEEDGVIDRRRSSSAAIDDERDSNSRGKARARKGSGASSKDPVTSASAAATYRGRPLVLCLNTKGEEELLLDALMADGVPPNRLPEVVDAECTPAQRQSMYGSGGVFLVTSRILIVDLLNKTVLPHRISGMLVHKAHRVVETSSEAFILRIYREGNASGFVKGFTDEPESLLAGFGKLEKILRNLSVAKVFLWPRFHSLVAESLERSPPEVEELVQGLTGPTKEVQQAIVVLMDHTLKELRGAAPLIDSAELTVENCIFHSFDRSVKRQLEPEWHRVGFKTKQLLQDLKTLRSLLDYIFRYDAITFYQLLLAEKSKAAAVRDPPLWIGTAAAQKLFVTAKARIYTIEPKSAATAASKKSDKATASKKVAQAQGKPRSSAGSRVECGAAVETATHELSLVLEENAKWRLAADILKEIRDVHASRRRKAERQSKTGTSGDSALPPAGGARVLVLVRDEHTCAQIRQHSALGGSQMMRRRFLEFIRDAEERTGRIAAARGGRKGWKGGRRASGGGNNIGKRGGSGRWNGSGKRGMTGVGVGASPVFSGGGGSGSGDGDGSSGGTATPRSSPANTERALLKKMGVQLETELRSGALARRSHPTTSSSFASPNEEVFLGAHAARAMQGGRGHGRGGAGGRGGVSKRSRGGSDRDSIPVDGADEASPEQGDSEHKAAAENEAQVEDDVLGAEALPSSASGKSKGSKKSKRTAGKGNGMGGNLSAENGGMSKAVDSVDLTDKGGNGSSRILDTEEDPGSDRRPSETEGSGERRGVERGDTKGVSRPVKDGGVRDRRGGGGGGVGGGSGVVFEPLPSLHAVMFSYAQASESLNILEDLEPDFVVLYDPDAAFVRTLEAYQAGRPRGRPPLAVYFMLYEQSVEEQRYLTSLDRETKAFKSLIEEKARMTVPVRTTAVVIPSERRGKGTVTRLSAPASESLTGADVTGRQLATSRRGGGRNAGAKAPLRVVVDLREFRSVLPNLLHQQGFELVPLVIAVGDYVLTPEICVERKSLSDLFQSMSSGRLYNQVESMLKHYKVPVLLIEFNPDKAFCLLGSGDLTTDIKLTSITSQLTLLTIHFPQLRILWSKSEHATADMFKELMKNNAPVDVVKAQTAGGGEEEGTGEDAAASAKDLLMRLPGVNVYNYRNVIREVETIAELSGLSEGQLKPLLGAGNASKLYKFFRQPAPL